MKHRILVVDDDPFVRKIVISALNSRYRVDAAESGEQALKMLGNDEPYAAILADMIMVGMTGVELLAECEKRSPFTERILVTGDTKQQTAVVAVNVGHVFRFLAKPFDVPVLLEVVDEAMKHRDVMLAEQALLDTTLRNSINILLEIMSAAEPHCFELSQRLRLTVRTFAMAQHLPNAWELEMAAALARIGTATLPAPVLRKLSADEQLNTEEERLLAQVPEMGWRLLKAIPRLEGVAESVRYQAKNFDGTGLPIGPIVRDDIPLGARVLKIFTCRALLEMEGIAQAQAKQQMEARRGEFDPALLQASFEVFPQYLLQGVSAKAEVHMVAVADLRANQVVVTDIRTKDGVKVVTAGSRLTKMAIQRIANYVELRLLTGPFCVQEIPVEQASSLTHSPFEVAAT
jgi:response regulator RpfG family c-di-GMP phosphodiesterase